MYRQHDQYRMHVYSINDTFGTLFGPPSVFNLRKEELERGAQRGNPAVLTLFKDCSKTVLRKEVKREDNPVPNKTPPFNTAGAREGPRCCFKTVSPRVKVEKRAERQPLRPSTSEQKHGFSLFLPG